MSSFDGIRQRQALFLLSLLSRIRVPTIERIERRYTEHAERFQKTLTFLLAIGAVVEKDGQLHAIPALEEVSSRNKDATPKILLALLTASDTCYADELFSYLSGFRITNGLASHYPRTQERSAQSGIRNYLLDLGIISCDRDATAYVLCPEHLDLYVEACRGPTRMSPRQLHGRLRQQDLLGRRAEEAIVQYERTRVGDCYSDHVRHVAIDDVSAGYDILSITLDPGGVTTPRYIEVKAVPRQTLRFFMSANEIAVAEALGDCYYLYLVPVVVGGDLDVEDVRIIADPCSAVLSNHGCWLVETNGVRCSAALSLPGPLGPDCEAEDG